MPKPAPRISSLGLVAALLMVVSLGVVLYGLWEEGLLRFQRTPHEDLIAPQPGDEETPSISRQRRTFLDDPFDDDLITSPLVEMGDLAADDIVTTTAVFLLDQMTTGPNAQVSGYVLNELEDPVAGAELRLLPLAMFAPIGRPVPPVEDYREVAREEAIATFKSERDGYYYFDKLDAGRYEIFVEHPEYAPFWETSFILLEDESLPGVDIRLEQGLTLSGRVTDPNGNPVDRALIQTSMRMKRLIAAGGEYVYVLIPYVYESSDENGEFTLIGLGSGENFITVSKAGWVSAEIERKIQKKNPGPPLKVTLQPASEISGVVIGPDDSLIPGAKVTLKAMYDAGGATLTMPSKGMSATTDAEGGFSLAPLPRGIELDLLVEKAGLTSTHFPRLQSGTLNNRLRLTAGAQVAGGAFDIDTGEGVSNLKILLTRLPKAPDIPFTPVHTFTGADGRYLFWGLPEGTYRAQVESLEWVSSPRDNITLKANQKRGDIDFEMYRPMMLTGRVINVETGAGIQGAKVTASGNYGPAFRKTRSTETLSTENGLFTLNDVLPGQWRLTSSTSGYFFSSANRSNTVWLKRGEPPPSDIILEMEPAGELTGTVYTPAGYPCEKAIVVLDHGRKRIEADSNGNFAYNDINVSKALTVRVYAWKRGFAPAAGPPVLLSSDDRRQTTEVELGSGYYVEGLVVDEDDAPIRGATVRLTQHNFATFIGDVNQETRTNTRGEFAFSTVAPGSITVAASAEGRAGASRRVTLQDDGDYPKLVLQLRRGFEIAGVVYDDFGQPIEGASVAALGVPGLGNVSASSGKDGTFVIKNLREGAFPLQCTWSPTFDKVKFDYRNRLAKVATGSPPVRITMPINGTLEGTVFSAETMEPVPSFSVEFAAKCPQDDGGTYDFKVAKSFTSGYGRFFLTNLPTGNYTIRVSASGFVPGVRENVSLISLSQRDIGDIFLETAGGLKGTVIDTTTGDGVSGARVTALPTSVGKAANTDYSGFFQLTGLQRGSYALRVTGSAHLPVDTPNFTVLEGEITDVGRIFVEPGATAKGRVLDAQGVGASGITIQAQSGSGARSTRSDAAGYYQIQGLTPGRVEFVVSGKFGEHNLRRRFTAQLSAGLDNQVNFVMDNSFSLTGEFPAIAALESAAVSLYPLEDGGPPDRAWALQGAVGDNRSQFSVTNILAGRYLMCWRGRLSLPDAAAMSPDVRWIQSVDVGSRNTYLSIDTGQRSITGDVASGDTAELQSGVKVRLVKTDLPGGGGNIPAEQYSWVATTDANGLYEFAFLPAGRYRITFTTADDRQFFTDVLLRPADTVVNLNVEF